MAAQAIRVDADVVLLGLAAVARDVDDAADLLATAAQGSNPRRP